jgi:hypothetical protein
MHLRCILIQLNTYIHIHETSTEQNGQSGHDYRDRTNTQYERRVRRLLVAANIVPNSSILVTLMMEELRSSEALVLPRLTRRNIPEDAILHSHRREHLKS